MPLVMGHNRVPEPPANMIPFTGHVLSERRLESTERYRDGGLWQSGPLGDRVR